MKLIFWFEDRGGMRSDKKTVELPDNYSEDDIKSELEDWRDSLNSQSEYQTYGWDEVKE